MATVYTVFMSSELMGECQIFTAYHPDRVIVSNERILAELRARCAGVEFIGETSPISGRDAVANIDCQRERLDGVLFFGSPPDELTSLGLPIVAVYPLWGQWC